MTSTYIGDKRNQKVMFISDESNNAIRKLDSEFVRGMTQDNLGNLFVTFNDGITKVSIESGITEILVGSTTAEGFRDGPFAFVQFDDPRDVVMINDSTLVVADDGNHRLRVSDLITNTSSSICVVQCPAPCRLIVTIPYS